MSFYLYLPMALFYLVLLALALWGAWLGWTRSKSPTARGFVVVLSLVWAGFTVAGALNTYRKVQEVGLDAFMSGDSYIDMPVVGDARLCVLCYQGPAGRVYVVAGSRIEGGEYHVTAEHPVRYSLRFKEGRVQVAGEGPLSPGCHVGTAEPYATFEIVQATGFRLEVGDAASCD